MCRSLLRLDVARPNPGNSTAKPWHKESIFWGSGWGMVESSYRLLSAIVLIVCRLEIWRLNIQNYTKQLSCEATKWSSNWLSATSQNEKTYPNRSKILHWVWLWSFESFATLNASFALGISVVPHHHRVWRTKGSVSEIVELSYLWLTLGEKGMDKKKPCLWEPLTTMSPKISKIIMFKFHRPNKWSTQRHTTTSGTWVQLKISNTCILQPTWILVDVETKVL